MSEHPCSLPTRRIPARPAPGPRLSTRVLCLLIAVSVWSPAGGQAKDRLHLLMVQGRVAGADNDVSLIRGMIGRTWEQTTEYVVVQNGANDREKILTAIAGLTPGPNDIVLFYYSGHGATAAERHFLQLDSGQSLFRDELRRRLAAKGGRLTVLITDCCSVRVEVPGDEAGAQAAIDVLEENLQRLFSYSGVADINSSYTGQYAWGEPGGGVFTSALAEALWKPCLDWQEFFAVLQVETHRGYWQYRRRALNPQSGFRPRERAMVRKQERQTPQHFGLPGGLLIEQVFPNTSAVKMTDASGKAIRPERGDRLLAINGQQVGDSQHFVRMMDGLGRGAPVQLTILDQRTRRPLNLRGRMDQGGDYRLGLSVEDGLPEQDGRSFPGLTITQVVGGTSATRMSLPSGRPMQPERRDRLLYINDRIMLNTEQFQRVVAELPRSAEITMTIIDHRTGNHLDLLGRLDQGGPLRLGLNVAEPD